MMKTEQVVLMFGVFFFAVSIVSGQEDKKTKPVYGWQKEVVGNANVSQTSFDNWAQGGENTLAWQLNLNASFVNNQKKFNWANACKFSFGKTKMGDEAARKSMDEIKLESVLTYKIGAEVDPYVSAAGETQFAKGYSYTDDTRISVSDFFDPAYFTQAIGFSYHPITNFKTRMGASLKETITRNHPIPYADDPTTEKIEKSKVEFGVESVTNASKKLSENTLFTSKLDLFSNLQRFDEIDLRWDSLVTTKISNYISINFNFMLFYDKDISKKRQIKQALTVGFVYTFI